LLKHIYKEVNVLYKFFNECLVSLCFKKKYFLGGSQGQKYSVKKSYMYLVKTNK